MIATPLLSSILAVAHAHAIVTGAMPDACECLESTWTALRDEVTAWMAERVAVNRKALEAVGHASDEEFVRVRRAFAPDSFEFGGIRFHRMAPLPTHPGAPWDGQLGFALYRRK